LGEKHTGKGQSLKSIVTMREHTLKGACINQKTRLNSEKERGRNIDIPGSGEEEGEGNFTNEERRRETQEIRKR